MNERISALMDGELDDRAASDLIPAVAREDEAAACWRTYHLIGDALRGGCAISENFAARVQSRLAAEPTVLAPHAVAPATRAWLPMAAAASFAAVALVGWVAFGPLHEAAPVAPPVAEAPKPAAVPEAVAAAPIPAEAADYLLAHQLYSPRGTFQGMAPYVRSVSSER